MSKLDQMEIFYFVATWKSFSRAALELGVSKGFVSSQISALEHDLKVKLLHRTTRHLRLTEQGSLFLESCAKIVREQQLAISLLNEPQAEPSGQLKITAPPSLCSTVLTELVPEFQKQYPKISLLIDSSSTVKNLLQHDVDIALRITSTPDENYVARVITKFRFAICATPNYLKQTAALSNPDDLLLHNCLIYSADPMQNRWPFQIGSTTKFISVQGNLVSTDCSIIKNSLLSDQGVARLPHYALNKEIADKKLVVLFPEHIKIETPIYAIYASGTHVPLKIKSFISFFKDKLRENTP